MRLKTVTYKILKFSELSAKSKDVARQEYQCHEGYIRADEAMESITKLAEHFGGKIGRYEIDWFNSSYSQMAFEMPDDMQRGEIQRRLRELGTFNRRTLRGNGDCKLTGVCTDEDCIDGFRIAFHGGESDLSALMESAFRSWLRACQADCEDFYSDEQFGEHCDVNDYEFREDGSFESK